MYPNTAYTTAEDNNLRDLHAQGFNYEQIGPRLKFNRERMSVKERLYKLGLTPHPIKRRHGRPWTNIELSSIRRIQEQEVARGRNHWTYDKVLNLVPGRTYTSIMSQLLRSRRENGTTLKPKRKFTAEEDKELQNLLCDTFSVADRAITLTTVAERLKRSRDSVAARVLRLRNAAKFAANVKGHDS